MIFDILVIILLIIIASERIEQILTRARNWLERREIHKRSLR